MEALQIRRASALDAAGIVAVMEVVAAERIYSAIDQVWTVEQETAYLGSLSSRETFHVAVDEEADIVGLQSIERWSVLFPSMAHVGQVATFLLPRGDAGGLGGGCGTQPWVSRGRRGISSWPSR